MSVKVLLILGYYTSDFNLELSLVTPALTFFPPSFSALETTQAELFDLKTKYDEESTAKYVSR